VIIFTLTCGLSLGVFALNIRRRMRDEDILAFYGLSDDDLETLDRMTNSGTRPTSD
jgi:hypothetical protein